MDCQSKIMSKQIYKVRGRFASPVFEFSDKKNISGFQSILIDQNDFGYSHELNLINEIGKKFFNRLKSLYLQSGGNLDDYIELYFVAAQDQYEQWYLVEKSIKTKLLVSHDNNYSVVKSYQKSIDTFGKDEKGIPNHRYSYAYINAERISRKELPSTFKQYLNTAVLQSGMTAQEICDTKNFYK